jgi:hypothetical protein
MTLFAYLLVGLLVLGGLALMIHRIAAEAGQCPQIAAAARAAGVTITTGFVAIGGGVTLLIAVLIMVGPNPAMAIFAMGLNSLILGLGFTQAITTLRAAVQGPQERAAQTAASGGDI